MLGKQSGLGGGDHAYLDHVGRDAFYGFLVFARPLREVASQPIHLSKPSFSATLLPIFRTSESGFSEYTFLHR